MKQGCIILSLILLLTILLIAAGCTQPASVPVTPSPASHSSTKEELVAFVKEAVAYARANGKEAALAEISNPKGTFVRGDLYLYAYDFNGLTLAHPFNPEKIGVNRINETDALGTLFITNLRNAARTGSGFVEFSYINPSHNSTVEKKLGYVEKVDDDWWLGSGIYFGPVTSPIPSVPTTSGGLKEYVDAAAGYAQINGRTTALAVFNNRTGPFVTGDVYVYALDYAGNALALPFQPERVGTNFLSLNDSSGKPYTDIEIQLVRSGGGYLLYHYPDPAANLTSQLKISYVRPVDETYWIGAGIYTREDRLIDPVLQQFVTDAKAYALALGNERALAEFNNLNGSFSRGELYIFAYNYNGTVLSWPYRPDQVGQNRLNATDTVGSHHVQAFLEKARSGGGMVDYYSVNPATNTTQLKISYVMDIDGRWMLGAGRYMEPGTVTLAP